MEKYYHSVILDKELCMGCTNCIKKCPTEAIRVQQGKAKILNEKCIDCGECIRTCPYKAKIAQTDSWSLMENYKYKIALPAPSLYMQFDLKYTRVQILAAIKKLGFDYIYEVARGADIVTKASNLYIEKHKEDMPFISSACPAVVRLLRVRFPELLTRLMPMESPMEVSAANARREFCKMHNVSPEEVGVFFISPCAAKITSVKAPLVISKSNVDGVFGIKTVYPKLLRVLSKIDTSEVKLQATNGGVGWAVSGGEAVALNTENIISVDGIQNVVHVFEELEDGKLDDVDFIEASACTGGCLGGPLTVENLYVAKNRFRRYEEIRKEDIKPIDESEMTNIQFDKYPEYVDITTLDSDITVAMRKLREMNEIYKQLPALDCGACGSPSCRALAEDIVRGKANIESCIFVLRSRVRELAKEMMELEGLMPPVMEGHIVPEELKDDN
ncbi:MAG: 4Fe-4S dicluster domain-containing protein [Ruminococcaceae bacterium]|nr:4Fe-4S dicluster domain-containing protein [Oscillospiraceae bacterium]